MNAERSGRPAVGDIVLVRGWHLAQFRVVDTSDPSLIVLEAPSGKHLRVGERAVVLVEAATDVEPTR